MLNFSRFEHKFRFAECSLYPIWVEWNGNFHIFSVGWASEGGGFIETNLRRPRNFQFDFYWQRSWRVWKKQINEKETKTFNIGNKNTKKTFWRDITFSSENWALGDDFPIHYLAQFWLCFDSCLSQFRHSYRISSQFQLILTQFWFNWDSILVLFTVFTSILTFSYASITT